MSKVCIRKWGPRPWHRQCTLIIHMYCVLFLNRYIRPLPNRSPKNFWQSTYLECIQQWWRHGQSQCRTNRVWRSHRRNRPNSSNRRRLSLVRMHVKSIPIPFRHSCRCVPQSLSNSTHWHVNTSHDLDRHRFPKQMVHPFPIQRSVTWHIQTRAPWDRPHTHHSYLASLTSNPEDVRPIIVPAPISWTSIRVWWRRQRRSKHHKLLGSRLVSHKRPHPRFSSLWVAELVAHLNAHVYFSLCAEWLRAMNVSNVCFEVFHAGKGPSVMFCQRLYCFFRVALQCRCVPRAVWFRYDWHTFSKTCSCIRKCQACGHCHNSRKHWASALGCNSEKRKLWNT